MHVRIWLIFAAQSPHCLLNAGRCWTTHFTRPNSKADLVSDLSNRQIYYQFTGMLKFFPSLGKCSREMAITYWPMIFPQNNMPWSVISGCFSCPCLCWNLQGKEEVVAMPAPYSPRTPPYKTSQLGRVYLFWSAWLVQGDGRGQTSFIFFILTSVANTYTPGFLHAIQYRWEEHSSLSFHL